MECIEGVVVRNRMLWVTEPRCPSRVWATAWAQLRADPLYQSTRAGCITKYTG